MAHFKIICQRDFHERILPETYCRESDAQQHADILNKRSYSGAHYAIRLMTDKMLAWRSRERNRFENYEYKSAVWHSEHWYVNSRYGNTHFVHISTIDPTKIAFTPNEESGVKDRHVSMRPGRYLQKFFSDFLYAENIKTWISMFNAEHERNRVLFAKTADEIEHVYKLGPRSCMAFPDGGYMSPFHPTRVYAAGDLQVAYLVRDNRITARCVVWPEKKRAGRIYGDAVRLAPILVNLGYSIKDGNLEDARLVRHETKNGFVVPYLDDPNVGVIDDGQYLIIKKDCTIRGNSIRGLSQSSVRCGHCGEYVLQNVIINVADRQQMWCRSCVNKYARTCYCCSRIDSLRSSRFSYDYYGRDVCESCLNLHHRPCPFCNQNWNNTTSFYRTVYDNKEACYACIQRMSIITHCHRYARLPQDCNCAICLIHRRNS